MKFFQKPEYKFLFDLLKSYKFHLLFIIIFNVLLSGIALVLPYLVKLQTDQLQQANTNLFELIQGSPAFIFTFIIGIVLFFNSLDLLFNFLSRSLNKKVQQKISLQAETEFFKKLAHLDSDFLNNPRNRRITNNIFNVSYIFERILMFLPTTMRNTFSFFGVIPFIFIIDYRVGIFTFLMSLIDYYFYQIKIKQENKITMAHENLQQKINELRYMLLFNFQKILFIDQENKVLKAYQQKQKNNHFVESLKFKNSERWSFLFWILENFTTSIITIIFGYQVLQ